MSKHGKPITILMADDDDDDRRLTREALLEGRLANDLRFVENGEELMDYLRHHGKYAATEVPRPGLILLDLNMPRKDGRTVLKEIKSDPELRQIPVVVLTTSQADEDIFKSYDLGVNLGKILVRDRRTAARQRSVGTECLAQRAQRTQRKR